MKGVSVNIVLNPAPVFALCLKNGASLAETRQRRAEFGNFCINKVFIKNLLRN
jgi:hypothetical protein